MAAPPDARVTGLVVVVADLLHRPGARRRECRSGRAVDSLAVVATSVLARAEVEVDAVLEWVSDGVLATGTASAGWEAECRRCLRPVAGRAQAEFRELYQERPVEGETYPMRGDRIDLGLAAADALLLALPPTPVCRYDCAGLCPTCGADRNEAPCRCGDAGPATPIEPGPVGPG